ncbi:MAG: hypothetical protein WCR46_15900 [Deltaproteobacteria bacterium]
MAMTLMPPIELDGISRQKPSHDSGDRRKTSTQQKMQVVGYQRPCKTIGVRFNQHMAESVHKSIPVHIVKEDLAVLNSVYHDVM